MKLFLTIFIFSFITISASSCYTAVNGFKAVGELTGELSKRLGDTQSSLSDLGSVTNTRHEKTKTIADLQKKIRLMQSKSYDKSKQILHNLKVKNEELNIQGSLSSME